MKNRDQVNKFHFSTWKPTSFACQEYIQKYYLMITDMSWLLEIQDN